MSFFNDKQLEAILSGTYICPECGEVMKFEDEWEDTLVCLSCGYSVDSDMYGFNSEEEYNALFPRADELDENEDNEEKEYYEEECGELSHD